MNSMEPLNKRAKITGHFRVALKPQDVNVQRSFKKLKKHQDIGKENIEIITIEDDEDDENSKEQQQPRLQILQPQQPLQPHPQSQAGSSQHSHNASQPLQEHYQHHPQHEQKIVIKDVIREAEERAFREEEALRGEEALRDEALKEEETLRLEEALNEEEEQASELQEDELGEQQQVVVVVEEENDYDIINRYIPPPGINENIIDYDKSLLNNVYCEPFYAWDSFTYERERELKFRNRKYLNPKDNDLHSINPRIRARLVDWLVDIQNDFRLDHEPLYMAVKLADQYLMRRFVSKQELELLYLTTIFMSVKFDHRPNAITVTELIQEFGGRYDRKQVISFEVDILATLKFDIRYPLSYGFLRRYARCTHCNLQTLTLARYILESSLLEYEMIDVLESKIAAASLLLAFRMLHLDEAWNETTDFYTGYTQKDLEILLTQLNYAISRPVDRKVSAIRRKYGNEVFMSVTNIPPLPIQPPTPLCPQQ